ncbi:hypothetical protein RI685_16195 (plasmid) [Clavibacter michiganensis]|uniref:hypothetical protein n=1 Tax=Clavibacter michiganensis TaxID=28447 RepID=UPI003D9FBC57
MAEVRKSGKAAAARKVARERATELAAEFRRREAALEELAVDYFVAVDGIEEIEADAARQIDEIRARADAETAAARREATSVMGRMLAQGITRSEVAKRLKIAVRDVAKAPAEAVDTARVTDGQPTDDDAGRDATGETSERVAEPAFAQ